MDGWRDTGILTTNAVPTRFNPLARSQVEKLVFDDNADLLWTGDSAGRIASYRPGLLRYTAVKAHNSSIKDILTNEKGIVTLSNNNIRLHNRRGLIKQTVNDPDNLMSGLHAMSYSSRGVSEVIAAGDSDYFLSVNLERGTVSKKGNPRYSTDSTESSSLPSTILKLTRASHYIASGSSTGAVELYDPNSLSPVHKFQAHLGPIVDLHAKQHLIITCGYSSRKTGYMPDPLVNVYDVRAMKPLPPLAFPAGAAFAKLHPKLSNCCVIASLSGQLQFVDITNPAVTFLRQIGMTSYLVNMDISPSGDFLALADNDGVLRLWTGVNPAVSSSSFTNFGSPLEYPTYDIPEAAALLGPFDPDDSSRPLSSVGLPYYKDELLSSWSESPYVFNTGIPPVPINPELVAHAKTGLPSIYNPEKYGKRNVAQPYVSLKLARKNSVAVPKFISEKSKSKLGEFEDEHDVLSDYDDDYYDSHLQDHSSDAQNPGSEAATANTATRSSYKIPKIYRKLEIKYSKFGVHDFDFDFYNKTKFAGLENPVQNSCYNALLQLYRYCPSIYNFAVRACCKESLSTNNSSNLLVQLGYLYDMLHKAKGTHCEASNFLNSLRHNPKAIASGISFDDYKSRNPSIASLASAKRYANVSAASTSASRDTTNPDPHPHIPMQEPVSDSNNRELQSFAGFLMEQLTQDEKSLHVDIDYGIENICGVGVSTVVKGLGCGSESSQKSITFGLDLLPAKSSYARDFTKRLENGLDRYFQTRGWCDNCKKYHLMSTRQTVTQLPSVVNILVNNGTLTVTGKSAAAKPQFTTQDLVTSFKACKSNDVGGRLSIVPGTDSRDGDMYELLGYVCEITELNHPESHLVAIIQIEGGWYLFNDFLVREIKEADALDVSQVWKRPLLLLYQRTSDVPPFIHAENQPIDDSILYVDNFIPGDAKRLMHTKLSYELLTREEAPKPGTLVAIDAEFVMTREEETDIQSDGRKTLLKPKTLSLARVSVLRDNGVPFIDDYIVSTEPVVDYFTEFSGIEPGDLDPKSSTKRLVDLETAYRRLWLLLNLGCVFIGHALVNDFRTINIQVPTEQIRDTYDMYYLSERQRRLSLKFLAWCLLDINVQTGNHDSIEDANTALLLYKRYVELQEKGEFQDALKEVYRKGTQYNFKPPVDQSEHLHKDEL